MTDPSELALASDTAIRLQNESAADRDCAVAELQLRLPIHPLPHCAGQPRPPSPATGRPLQLELQR